MRNFVQISNLLQGMPHKCSRSVDYLKTAKRFFNIHEYQALALINSYGVPTPQGYPANTAREAFCRAEEICDETGDCDKDFVVKAQIYAGGRSLGYFKESNFNGGVHICSSPKQVKQVAQKMLNNTLITKQTGSAGKKCSTVFISERVYIRREKYFAVTMDRDSGGPVMIGSKVGGTSIEDIAQKDANAIIKHKIDITEGLTEKDAFEFAKELGFDAKRATDAGNALRNLYQLFIDKDCTLVEINPLAELSDGRIMICDAKLNFDSNAEYRQEKIFDLKDETQEDEREVRASRFGLNYVGLDGNIGCMVNGAGLAMATMDIIANHGGTPANFLDVGGGANNEQVVEAFRILQHDEHVFAIFVNIFGGIMRCDTIALGIIKASQVVGLTKPLVVRLEGTKQAEAREMLEDSGLKMMFTDNLEEAAAKVVKMAHIMEVAKSVELDVAFAM